MLSAGLSLRDERGDDRRQAPSSGPRDGDHRGLGAPDRRHRRLRRVRTRSHSPRRSVGRPHQHRGDRARRRLLPVGSPGARALDVPLHQPDNPRHGAAARALRRRGEDRPLRRAWPLGRDSLHLQREGARRCLPRRPTDHRRPRNAADRQDQVDREARPHAASCRYVRSVGRRAGPRGKQDARRRAEAGHRRRPLRGALSGPDHGAKGPPAHGARGDGCQALHMAPRQTARVSSREEDLAGDRAVDPRRVPARGRRKTDTPRPTVVRVRAK